MEQTTRSQPKGKSFMNKTFCLLLIGAIVFAVTACSSGGSENSTSGGTATAGGSGSAGGGGGTPTNQQQAQSQFCSDLAGLGTAAGQLAALGPSATASDLTQAVNYVQTSYQSVNREANSVPNVQMDAVNSAYSTLASTAQSVPSNSTPGQIATALQAPAKNLQSAVVTTENQAKCPIASPTSGTTATPQATPTSP